MSPNEVCFYCPSGENQDSPDKTTHKCRSCNNSFCKEHASDLDTDYCMVCGDEPHLTVKSEPVIVKETSPDGAVIGEHKVGGNGRRIEISGDTWWTENRIIAEMTEEELRLWALKYDQLISEAEKMLDYRRTMRTVVGAEIDGRDRVKRRRRAAERACGQAPSEPSLSFAEPSGESKRSGVSKARSVQPVTPDSIIAAAKAQGISMEQLLAQLQAVAAGKK